MRIKKFAKLKELIIPGIIAAFNIIIILFPHEILTAARTGLSLWFNNVLPSLLPFIVGTNILTGLGFVSFLGAMLEPIMKPLFGVCGQGGYALVVGMTSGYPMGAKTVATLRERKEITKTEAERLMSFCNNSGPLFIIGAVGAGLFNDVSVGYFVILTHFVSAILTGMLFKYYKYEKPKRNVKYKRLLAKGLQNMEIARQKDNRAFSEILGQSVKNAMETLLVIGAYIVLFCVIVEIFGLSGVTYFATQFFAPVANAFNIDNELFKGLFVGIFEVTNGSHVLAALPHSKAQMIILATIITFGGFSIFAQTINFTHKTDISTLVILLSKIVCAAISAIVGATLYPFFTFESANAVPVFLSNDNTMFNKLATSSVLFGFSIATILLIIVLTNIFNMSNKHR